MSFICAYCSKNFKQKVSLKEHIIKKICFIKKEHVCWCGKECISPAALKVHKSKFHSSRVKYETILLNFSSFVEFSAWKETIEEETSAKFVKVRGVSVLKNGSKKIKFVCHRSGKVRLKTGERKRATRKKGSCKLNANCPAYVRIEEDMNGAIKAEYCNSHLNHRNEIQYLTLTRKERKKIADDLNKGATIEEVLEEIRNSSISNECNQLKRIHIVTKADLTNIIKEFKITFKERLAKDATCVHSFVQECEKIFGRFSPIKFFKPQNIDGIEGMEETSPEDFILIIITATQKQMLTQYEFSQICTDSTHKTKGFEFHLTSILTINDSGVSLPVAFCISNSVNENVMSLFFSTIMKECGQIRTSIFTSHDVPIFVNAWCKVMGVPDKWQVDKDLQQNLQSMKISTDEGSELDLNIRTMLKELDEQVLTILLKKFVTKFLEHESTNELGQFFGREYISGATSGVDVGYRRYTAVHANLKLEAMLRVLKNAHLKNLKMRKLDFSIFRLLKMCWDNLFSRLAYLADENVAYTLEILEDRHASALSIPSENIVRRGGKQLYEIRSLSNANVAHAVDVEILECSCQLRCPHCDTCLHVYSCTCADYSVVGNFCKHIHAVQMFEKRISAAAALICECSSDHEEVVVSADEVRASSATAETKENSGGDAQNSRDELIKTLLRITHLAQTNSYEYEIYEKSGKLIKKALELFNEAAGLPKTEDDDKCSSALGEEKVYLLSPELAKAGVSEIMPSECTIDELQVDVESQVLVDDVVEEVVYVDVHTTPDSLF